MCMCVYMPVFVCVRVLRRGSELETLTTEESERTQRNEPPLRIAVRVFLSAPLCFSNFFFSSHQQQFTLPSRLHEQQQGVCLVLWCYRSIPPDPHPPTTQSGKVEDSHED